MTYHGGPRDTIKSIVNRQNEWQKIATSRRRKGNKKYFKNRQMTLEEKMAIPAYAEAVAVNLRHGITRADGVVSNGRSLKGGNAATKFKNRYKKKRFVSLPKITMPMGDEE